jgi:hypothetical protein
VVRQTAPTLFASIVARRWRRFLLEAQCLGYGDIAGLTGRYVCHQHRSRIRRQDDRAESS